MLAANCRQCGDKHRKSHLLNCHVGNAFEVNLLVIGVLLRFKNKFRCCSGKMSMFCQQEQFHKSFKSPELIFLFELRVEWGNSGRRYLQPHSTDCRNSDVILMNNMSDCWHVEKRQLSCESLNLFTENRYMIQNWIPLKSNFKHHLWLSPFVTQSQAKLIKNIAINHINLTQAY